MNRSGSLAQRLCLADWARRLGFRLRQLLYPSRPRSFAKPVLLRFEQLEDRTAPASYFTLQNPGQLYTQEGSAVSLNLNDYLDYSEPPPETAGSITFTASDLPPGLTLDASTGVISGQPDYSIANPDQPQVDFSVTLTATDGTESDSVTFTWTILDSSSQNSQGGSGEEPNGHDTGGNGSSPPLSDGSTGSNTSGESSDHSHVGATSSSQTAGSESSNDNDSNLLFELLSEPQFLSETAWITHISSDLPYIPTVADPDFEASFPDISQAPALPLHVSQQLDQAEQVDDLFSHWVQSLDNDPLFANSLVINPAQPVSVSYHLESFSAIYQRTYTIRLNADSASAYFQVTVSSTRSFSTTDEGIELIEEGSLVYSGWFRVNDQYVFNYENVGHEFQYRVSVLGFSFIVSPFGRGDGSWFNPATMGEVAVYPWTSREISDELVYSASSLFNTNMNRRLYHTYALSYWLSTTWTVAPPSGDSAESNPSNLSTYRYNIAHEGSMRGLEAVSDHPAAVSSLSLPEQDDVPQNFFADLPNGTTYLQSLYRHDQFRSSNTLTYTADPDFTSLQLTSSVDSNNSGRYAHRYYAAVRSVPGGSNEPGTTTYFADAWLTDYQVQGDYQSSTQGEVTYSGDQLQHAEIESSYEEDGQVLRNRRLWISINHHDDRTQVWDTRKRSDHIESGTYTRSVTHSASWSAPTQPDRSAISSFLLTNITSTDSTEEIARVRGIITPEGFPSGFGSTVWIARSVSNVSTWSQQSSDGDPLSDRFTLEETSSHIGSDTFQKWSRQDYQSFDGSHSYAAQNWHSSSASWRKNIQRAGPVDRSGNPLTALDHEQPFVSSSSHSRTESWSNESWQVSRGTSQPTNFQLQSGFGTLFTSRNESRTHVSPEHFVGSLAEEKGSSQTTITWQHTIGSYTQGSTTYHSNNKHKSIERTTSSYNADFLLENDLRFGSMSSFQHTLVDSRRLIREWSTNNLENSSGYYHEVGSTKKELRDSIFGVVQGTNTGEYSRTIFQSEQERYQYVFFASGQTQAVNNSDSDSISHQTFWWHVETSAPPDPGTPDQPADPWITSKRELTITFTSQDGSDFTETSRSFKSSSKQQQRADLYIATSSETTTADGAYISSSQTIKRAHSFEQFEEELEGTPDSHSIKRFRQEDSWRKERSSSLLVTTAPLFPSSNYHEQFYFESEYISDNRLGNYQDGREYFHQLQTTNTTITYNSHDAIYSDPDYSWEDHHVYNYYRHVTRSGNSDVSSGQETVRTVSNSWGSSSFLGNSSSYGDPNYLRSTREVYDLRWEGEELVKRERIYPTWRDQLASGFYQLITGNYGEAFEIFAGLAQQAIDYVGEVAAYYAQRTVEFAAGMLSSLTAGISDRIIGYFSPETLEKLQQSSWYQAGAVTGIVVGIAAAFVNPCSLAASGSALVRLAGTAYRVWQGVEAVGNAINAVEAYKQGDWVNGTLHAAGALFGASQALRVCFAAGTKLLTPQGPKPIETFEVGDEIITRLEWEPDAPPLVSQVEARFENVARIWHLHLVGGQVIRTSAEHPFYVEGRGWVPAGELRPGDLLVSHDGQRIAVAELYDTGAYEHVYNLAIRSFHTYFVCDETWPFSVWAHNRCTFADVLSRGQPWKGRFPRTAQPDAILYRMDNQGRITSYQVYNRLGLPMKRVDLLGKPHGGVPTPHVTVFRYDKSPMGLIPRPLRKVRPAFPWEIP